jgi:hypothetical protein
MSYYTPFISSKFPYLHCSIGEKLGKWALQIFKSAVFPLNFDDIGAQETEIVVSEQGVDVNRRPIRRNSGNDTVKAMRREEFVHENLEGAQVVWVCGGINV